MPDTEKDILKEIRDNYSYYQDAWRDVREEARIDMRYVSGDPWEPDERRFREANDRPCMTWDELNPYINQLINDPRQNKRGIKIDPKGYGASQKTAELRENKIREICYNSKAQAAFTTGFQGAAERSYGWWRVGKRFVTQGISGDDLGPEAFNQELYIGRIPNPDTVLIDPTYKEADTSDKMGCFITDTIRRVDFKNRFPHAEITDFTPEQMNLAPQWLHEKEVTVAEYWRVTMEKKTLHLIDGEKSGPVVLYEDELPTGFDMKRVKRSRDIERRKVTQYITNGLEILDTNPIEIPWIPIIPVFGKEIYVDDGGGSRRRLISLVRLARDPYMAYCFYRSQEAEESGLTPKVPYIVYKGQINAADMDIWQTCHKVPRGYLEIEPTTDTAGAVLPLPERQPFQPNFQAYEIVCEAARRAIQTAMGGSNLPTAAQRRNEKSGVALQEINDQEQRGTFHFIDNYNAALELTGTMLDAWMPFVYDTPRDEMIRKADETASSIRINDPNFEEKGPDGQPVKTNYDMTTGEHGVTVSVGPNFDSQRDEASALADTIIQELKNLPLAAPQAQKLLSLTLKLKQGGPIVNEMADIISPPADQQAQMQQMQQTQAQLQQSQQVIQELQAELQKLQLEKAGKVIQGETQKQIQQMKNDIDVLKALLASKQDVAAQEREMYKTFWLENHGAAHEVGMQATQHAHEASQAAAAADVAQQQAQQQPQTP